MSSRFSAYFPDNSNQVFTATSPGRLDVMGGIADYSGSLVLQMPIREQTTAALALRHDHLVRIITLTENQTALSFEIHYTELLNQDLQPDYDLAHAILSRRTGGDWAGYILGCLLVLHKERGIPCTGADVLIASQVPAGKGVSSSAALEVAVFKALALAHQLHFPGTELPRLAQKAENLVVKAPCGLMDQLSSYMGQSGKLLPIRCQPDLLFPLISLPADLHFIGIDSGIRHSVGGASYGEVRAAAFMGYSIIARLAGCDARLLEACRATGNRQPLPYQGYLSNIAVAEFEEKYRDALPESLSGKDFLSAYGYSIDVVTKVHPETSYAVRQATLHPVYENERVLKFMLLLREVQKNPNQPELLTALGRLMYESHESYSACGLGSEKTDELVQLARQNSDKGIFGAKITGGGSGGTVCLLVYGETGLTAAKALHQEYCRSLGKEVALFL